MPAGFADLDPTRARCDRDPPALTVAALIRGTRPARSVTDSALTILGTAWGSPAARAWHKVAGDCALATA